MEAITTGRTIFAYFIELCVGGLFKVRSIYWVLLHFTAATVLYTLDLLWKTDSEPSACFCGILQ